MSQDRGYVDVSYLQTAAELLAPIKQRSYALMHIQPGQRVLDVGCGPGIDTTALGQQVGCKGHVIGVDYDTAMLAAADQYAAQAGVGAWVEHWQGDATALAFDSGQFDACRSERLFMHLSHPERALAEMVRVTRSGGWIVVLDPDWGTFSVDTSEVDIERRLAHFRAERLLHNGYAGRQLYRLFKQSQLLDIALEPFPVHAISYAHIRYLGRLDEVEQQAVATGVITTAELHRWQTYLKHADSSGSCFASLSLIMAAGRKP